MNRVLSGLDPREVPPPFPPLSYHLAAKHVPDLQFLFTGVPPVPPL